jgi:hypothetical protein
MAKETYSTTRALVYIGSALAIPQIYFLKGPFGFADVQSDFGWLVYFYAIGYFSNLIIPLFAILGISFAKTSRGINFSVVSSLSWFVSIAVWLIYDYLTIQVCKSFDWECGSSSQLDGFLYLIGMKSTDPAIDQLIGLMGTFSAVILLLAWFAKNAQPSNSQAVQNAPAAIYASPAEVNQAMPVQQVPTFCGSCGVKVTGTGGKFCSSCGSALQTRF